MEGFTQLHNHDEYSLLDGFGSSKDWTTEAKRLGFKSLGVCNHGNVDSFITFQKACSKEGLIPIFGCELYIVENMQVKAKGETRCHVCTYVKDEQGWQNLLQMLTIANLDGFYKKPRIDADCLYQHCEGLVITTACTSSFTKHKWGRTLLGKLVDKIRTEDIFLEVMPHMLKEQIEQNELCLKLAKKHSLQLIASNDCHYPTEEGALGQEALLAIQRRAKWTDPNRWKFDVTGLYLKDRKEMMQGFREQKCLSKSETLKALANTDCIVEACSSFKVKPRKISLPKVDQCKCDETKFLRKLIKKGFKERVLPNISSKQVRTYKERLTEEFKQITNSNFQRYFLIVWELVNWCREQDIMIGPGRGSVGGSLMAYCLHITDVNPIKYGLIFSRFISPGRIDLPDIDMDFEDIRRNEIKEHLKDLYGEDNVCGVSTFLRMKGKMVLRDVGRVFEVPYADVDEVTKTMSSVVDNDKEKILEECLTQTEEGKRFQKKYPKVAKIALLLEGQIRGAGQHAAAVCVSSENLKEGTRCNLVQRKKEILVNWEKNDAEYMGFIKLDILGLSALTILNQTRVMIEKNYDKKIVFNDIDLNDSRALHIANKGHNVGIFQIGGSRGLSDYCKQLEIDNFMDIVNATSLWRPGTLRSGMAEEFVLRKHGKIKWDFEHPLMKPVTNETHGIILYQEQVMFALNILAGFDWKTCDELRKIIGKSKGASHFEKYKKRFVEGCKEVGTITEKNALKIWSKLISFGAYGFNKSHAVEYSVLTMWQLWLKAYYPVEFIACSLTYGSKNKDKRANLVTECKRLKIKIKLPKIGISDADAWTTNPKNKELFMPLTEIKGVGAKNVLSIIQGSKSNNEGFFKNKNAINQRMANSSVRKKLTAVRADDPDWFPSTEEELEKIQAMFLFDLEGLLD